MTILVDKEIDSRLAMPNPLASEIRQGDYKNSDSKVQAASLDLAIGEIYLPGAKADEPGGINCPITTPTTLEVGQTAVIRTREELDLGPALAAIGFPPASLSIRGLLMTNPGHVDPGYKGPLHLTLINMSRVSFPLQPGMRVISVLFIPLATNPDAPFNTRHPKTSSPISAQLLGNLSADFISVKERAQKIADESVRRAQIWAALIPIAIVILTIGGNWLFGSTKDDLNKLSERITKIEAKAEIRTLEDRIRKIEEANKPAATSQPGSKPQ